MLRIKELRELKGISMKEAARLLNLPYTTYVNYEKGLREPTSEVLIQIADFFGVSVDFLLHRNAVQTQQVPTIAPSKNEISEFTITQLTNRNILRIAARDGSYQERILTDAQLAALEAILDQMPDVMDDI